MTEKRNKVLVLGSDTRSFLTVIRSLGRAGKEVHVAWCSRSSVATTSKYVKMVHTLVRPPDPEWKYRLRELLSGEQYDLVIPCNDPSILPLHEEREFFSDYPIYLIDDAIFETAMDKAAMNRIAAAAGVRIPKEVTICSADQLQSLVAIPPPYVLKPTQSYVSTSLSTKNRVRFANDLATASIKIKSMLERTPVAVQQHFDGYGVGVEFLARHGEILTAFQHSRLHEPPGGGGSSYRKSCSLDPELLQATEALVKELHYTGIGMAEYRYNSKRRDWIFVELNSRFWGSLPLAVSCGVDFPSYLYDMFCEDRIEFPREYRVNHTCRNWFLDLQWLRKTLAANRFSVSKQLGLAWQLFCEARYPLTLRESSDTITWDDPAPGVNEIKAAIGAIPDQVRRKASHYLSRLGPLRDRARQRSLSRLSKKRKILFVCKGNICRSPLAEHYARVKLPHLERVESCGYFPKSDRPSPENAKCAAAQFGVDLSSHRSTVITQDAVDQADAIVIFDQENQSEIRTQFPRAKNKTFLLGTLLEGTEIEITDPYGGSVDDFRSIYTKIIEALDRLANEARAR